MNFLKKSAIAIAILSSALASTLALADASSPYYVGQVVGTADSLKGKKLKPAGKEAKPTAKTSAVSTFSGDTDCSDMSNPLCGGTVWDIYYDPSSDTTLYVEANTQLPQVKVTKQAQTFQYLYDFSDVASWNPNDLFQFDKSAYHFVYEELNAGPKTVIPKEVTMCWTAASGRTTLSTAPFQTITAAVGEAVAGQITGNYTTNIDPYVGMSLNQRRDLTAQSSANNGVTVYLADGGIVQWMILAHADVPNGGYIQSIQAGSGVNTCVR